MITKAIVRRQLKNGRLTNIQTFTFNNGKVISQSLNNTSYCADKVEECARKVGMTATYELTKTDSGEIHISTWTK